MTTPSRASLCSVCVLTSRRLHCTLTLTLTFTLTLTLTFTLILTLPQLQP